MTYVCRRPLSRVEDTGRPGRAGQLREQLASWYHRPRMQKEIVPGQMSSGIRARVRRIPLAGRWLDQLLDVPNPYFHHRSPADGVSARLVAEALAQSPSARILNIGSRTRITPTVINLDISEGGNASLIGDATFMPLATGSIDVIINIAVLEHTRSPHQIAAECSRVLKPGGRIYCGIPFFQMFHPDPIDMQRYTVTGIANLFPGLTQIDGGVEVGPASAMSLTLREFFAILFCFNSTALYNLLQVAFGYLFYPVKFLDYFMARNRFAYMIASSVYFVGEKPLTGRSAPQ
jgi:SAM-dependent methyltransferase